MEFSFLREQIVGIDSTFVTPFGERMMVYCDYTASGRCLTFVERYLQGLQRKYANTHTEDDVTGRSMTRILEEASRLIKESVNAGPGGRLVFCGTGATGAIDKLQQIVGVACPPATRQIHESVLAEFLGAEAFARFQRKLADRQPVVFIGPYEHHSNEVSWRNGLATVVQAELGPDGSIDLEHLESLLRDPRFADRLRIGSFSAASNVTGMRTPVKAIARLLHRHGAFACFDFAASAPYVEVDMSPPLDEDGGDASLDAVFISPHKFLGGPGSPGVLVFNERLYHSELPPTVAGGGTVDFVGPQGQDFIDEIEERERAGTPGVLQAMKAALAFQVKDAVTVVRIEEREAELTRRAMERWCAHPRISILGHPDPTRRTAIVSFNVGDPRGGKLHPKLVTVLLNDLFGIQSRAGCSCAGPYGHRLLGIGEERSEQFRRTVRKGFQGIKPGWCRIGFHYVMDDAEADYVIEAVEFLADHGHRFLCVYEFDPRTGAWIHELAADSHDEFSLAAALRAPEFGRTALSEVERRRVYARYFEEARRVSDSLASRTEAASRRLEGELGELQFFSV